MLTAVTPLFGKQKRGANSKVTPLEKDKPKLNRTSLSGSQQVKTLSDVSNATSSDYFGGGPRPQANKAKVSGLLKKSNNKAPAASKGQPSILSMFKKV